VSILGSIYPSLARIARTNTEIVPLDDYRLKESPGWIQLVAMETILCDSCWPAECEFDPDCDVKLVEQAVHLDRNFSLYSLKTLKKGTHLLHVFSDGSPTAIFPLIFAIIEGIDSGLVPTGVRGLFIGIAVL